MNVLGKNIDARLKALGMTQPQLAEKVGISQAAINKIVTGKTKKTGFLREIAAALQCTVEELADPQASATLSEAPAQTYRITTRKVPLISWVKAGNWCDGADPFAPGDAEEWLDCPFNFSDSAFCLRVIGDSMYADNGYREGEIILVDPEVAPRHGDDVVARTPDGKYTFKRLQITPDGTYLLALNNQHPQRKIEIPEDTHICGVVTASWTKRR